MLVLPTILQWPPDRVRLMRLTEAKDQEEVLPALEAAAPEHQTKDPRRYPLTILV
jgi:hypothetical protein